MRTTFGLLSLLLATPLGAQIHVDANAKSSGDGKSWATAFDTLQKGLAAATKSSEVWVAMGTYSGGFQVPAGVAVLGGFAGNETRASQRDVAGNPTVLDGGSAQRVVTLADSTTLDGLTIANGLATDPGGGGVLADGVKATIRRCMFAGNRNAGGRGSALNVQNKADVLLESSIFYKNPGSGHVIDITTATMIANHIVVYDNVSNGLHFQFGATVGIYNSVFAMNSGRGICHISANDNPTVENNLFWGNKVSHYHYRGNELTTIHAVNNLGYAANNITGDPMFVSPTTGDFSVKTGSPAIDAGRNSIPNVALAPHDYYANSRLLDGDLDGSMLTDMGAAEFANVRIGLSGTPMPGGTVQLSFQGTAGTFPGLILGTAPLPGALIAPFGFLFVDIVQPHVVLPWTNNSDTKLAVPKSIATGTTLAFQGFVIGTGNLNLSNLIDRTVQ